jgi:hypothetical protein
MTASTTKIERPTGPNTTGTPSSKHEPRPANSAQVRTLIDAFLLYGLEEELEDQSGPLRASTARALPVSTGSAQLSPTALTGRRAGL